MTELIRYVFPSRPTGRFLFRQTSGAGKVYEKEIVKAGTYTYWGKELDFNPDRLRAWVSNFTEMVAAGIELRVYWDHAAFDSRSVVGDIEDLYYDEATEILKAKLRIRDDEAIEKIESELIRHTSPAIGGYADDKGNQWPEAVVEISLVSEPVLRDQGPFIALSAKTKNEGDNVPETIDQLRIELTAANKRLVELEAVEKIAEGVKGLEVKLTAAEEKVTAVETERDELKTKVETHETKQFESEVKTEVLKLKAARQITPAEEEHLEKTLLSLRATPEARENVLKLYSDRKPAPTSSSIKPGDTAPTGDEADL